MAILPHKELKFHIKNDDYFGTLATVLDLMRQTLERNRKETKQIKSKNLKLLEGIRDELVYLQENYKIIKK